MSKNVLFYIYIYNMNEIKVNKLFIYDCNCYCYRLMACIYSNECYINMVYFNSPLEMEDFPINIIEDFIKNFLNVIILHLGKI